MLISQAYSSAWCPSARNSSSMMGLLHRGVQSCKLRGGADRKFPVMRGPASPVVGKRPRWARSVQTEWVLGVGHREAPFEVGCKRDGFALPERQGGAVVIVSPG